MTQEYCAKSFKLRRVFGRNRAHTGRKILIEFVSANPTGPLHVGHGRGAAYGASIAHLLEAVGHQVQREYYINDTGRQMDILTVFRVAQVPGALWTDPAFP